MGHFLGAVWVIQCALVALCRSSICSTDNWHDHFRWSPTFTRLKGGAGAASAG